MAGNAPTCSIGKRVGKGGSTACGCARCVATAVVMVAAAAAVVAAAVAEAEIPPDFLPTTARTRRMRVQMAPSRYASLCQVRPQKRRFLPALLRFHDAATPPPPPPPPPRERIGDLPSSPYVVLVVVGVTDRGSLHPLTYSACSLEDSSSVRIVLLC